MQNRANRSSLALLATGRPSLFALFLAIPLALASSGIAMAKTSQTVSFAAPATNAKTGALTVVGGTGMVSASASSGLDVKLATTTPSICSVRSVINIISNGSSTSSYTSGTVTGISAGNCTITANQAGDATYAAASQATLTVSIGASTSSSQTPISNARVFAYAEANYPSLFAGTPSAGQISYLGKVYAYQYYPVSGNYLAIDDIGGLAILGAYTGGALTSLGPVSSFEPTIIAWETSKSDPGTTDGATTSKGIRPVISWSVSVTPGIYTYVMQLCYGSQCTPLGGTILMDVDPNDSTTVHGTANGIDYGDLTRDELQQAISAATTELNTLIGNIWAGATTPSSKVIESVFNTALANATSVDDLKARIISGFTDAGYPSVSGSTTTETGTSDAANCASQPYLGGSNDPQTDYFCQIAQFDACLHNATGQTTYDADGRNQCTVLQGLLQSIGSKWSCRYCPYPY